MDGFETALAHEPVLRIFARKAHGISVANTPEKILHEMKLSVIDNMGCMVARGRPPRGRADRRRRARDGTEGGDRRRVR